MIKIKECCGYSDENGNRMLCPNVSYLFATVSSPIKKLKVWWAFRDALILPDFDVSGAFYVSKNFMYSRAGR